MLSLLRVHLPSDIPIVGCELTPYVLLRRPDNNVTTDDVPNSAPIEGYFLRYKWCVFLSLGISCWFVPAFLFASFFPIRRFGVRCTKQWNLCLSCSLNVRYSVKRRKNSSPAIITIHPTVLYVSWWKILYVPDLHQLVSPLLNFLTLMRLVYSNGLLL